jgi:hypothetical protein
VKEEVDQGLGSADISSHTRTAHVTREEGGKEGDDCNETNEVFEDTICPLVQLSDGFIVN